MEANAMLLSHVIEMKRTTDRQVSLVVADRRVQFAASQN